MSCSNFLDTIVILVFDLDKFLIDDLEILWLEAILFGVSLDLFFLLLIELLGYGLVLFCFFLELVQIKLVLGSFNFIFSVLGFAPWSSTMDKEVFIPLALQANGIDVAQ